MDLDFQVTIRVFEELKAQFAQPQPNLEKCKDLMAKLKLAMTKFSFPGAVTDSEQEKKQLLLAREILEHGVLLSVKLKDISSFERFVAQVKAYYFDYATKLPASSRQYMIIGLNLIHLLAQNKLDEFHTELELIPLEKHQDIYVKHPIQLEQYMMEGAYNKVLKAKDNVPHESYSFFMEMLMGTVRNEIADCLQKAYNVISVKDGQKLLGFSNPKQFESYLTKRNWTITTNNHGIDEVTFKVEAETKPEIPSMKLIQQQLHYASELERII